MNDWLVAARNTVSEDEVLARVGAVLSERVPGVELGVAQAIKLFGLNSGFFYFPLAVLLKETAPEQERAQEFATALALGHAYYFHLDRTLDDGIIDYDRTLLSPIFLMEYLNRLATATGAEPRSVSRGFYETHAGYIRAQRHEHLSRRSLDPLDDRDLEMLGLKSCPVQLPVALASGTDEPLGRVADDAFLQYSSGLQLMDDWADIEQDFTNGLSSIPVRITLTRGFDVQSWPDDVTSAEVRAIAEESGARNATLNLAKKFFAHAETLAFRTGQETLVEMARQRQQRCDVMMS